MAKKPTCEELEQKVAALEREIVDYRRMGKGPKEGMDLSVLLEHTNDCILISDSGGFPVMFNSAYAGVMKDAFGIEMKPGLKPHELLPDKGMASFWDGLHRRALSGEKFRQDYSHRFGAGDTRHFEISFHPIIKDGKVMGFSEITRDISKRKKAEEALQRSHDELERRVEERTSELVEANKRLKKIIEELKHADETLAESEEKFRTLAERSPNMIFISVNGRAVYVNERYEDVMGVTKEELSTSDLKLMTLVAPESIEEVKSSFARHMKGEEVPSFEYALITKQGRRIEAIIHTKLINYNGENAILGIITDITEHKRAEKALRESEEFRSSLLESSTNPLLVVEKDTLIKYVNPMLEELTGYTSAEIVGKRTPYPWWPEELKSGGATEMEKKFLTGFSKMEQLFQKRNREKFWVEINATPVIRDGEFKYGLSNWVDITERKRSEEELKKKERDLEARNCDLQELNAALRVLLKKRDDDKVEFEENVLTNVKETILPLVEKLKESRLNDRQEAFLNILESSLNEIVSPFLRRLSSKYLNFTPTEIQIASLVKEGRTTKEIADMQNSTTQAVDFHRKNIRKKLSLSNRKENLRTHLLCLTA